MKKILFYCILTATIISNISYGQQNTQQQWSIEKANSWYESKPWLVGCNFTPSTAINQLEMWQEESFDPTTIDRELKWANSLGFNLVRVYLHDLLWQQDSKGFVARIDKFLDIAEKYNIKTLFVLLDGCWDPYPELGKQRVPQPHIHNSGWVQSPSLNILKDTEKHCLLKSYIQGILKQYKNDTRVLLWELYNEPGNINARAYKKQEPKNLNELALELCKKVFLWSREINPNQPLSICVWQGSWEEKNMDKLTRFALENSDIVTYHNYTPFEILKNKTILLKRYNRPMICTEYMARPCGSTFFNALPFFKKHKIGACNWGFVAGKTQTQYPWDSWQKEYTCEPKIWFHDIFRIDGTPYDKNEVEFIKTITNKSF